MCCQPEQASRPSIGSVLQQLDPIFALIPESPAQVPVSEAKAAENMALIPPGFLDNPVPSIFPKQGPVHHFPLCVARLRDAHARLRDARINERARLERASLPRVHSPRSLIALQGVHHRAGSPPSATNDVVPAHARVAALHVDLPRKAKKPNQIEIREAWEKAKGHPAFEVRPCFISVSKR